MSSACSRTIWSKLAQGVARTRASMIPAQAAVTVSWYLSGAPLAATTLRMALRQRSTTSSVVVLSVAQR
jgi:hypothetical protein